MAIASHGNDWCCTGIGVVGCLKSGSSLNPDPCESGDQCSRMDNINVLLTHGIGHPYLPIPGGTGHWPSMIGGAFASHYPDCVSGVNDHAERWIFGL